MLSKRSQAQKRLMTLVVCGIKYIRLKKAESRVVAARDWRRRDKVGTEGDPVSGVQDEGILNTEHPNGCL